MKIVIGGVHLGIGLKEHIRKYLLKKGYEVLDFGAADMEHDLSYVDLADRVAQTVQSGKAKRGILFCGTGMGMNITANKHKGIYSAVVESVFAAHECREINNANILCMGGRIVGPGMAEAIVDAFLTTEFGGGIPEYEKVLSDFLKEMDAMEGRNFR
ncbi:MAG: RpiB/LacA/LacB family sugar-phosphate isomerase [Prevotella sp.]|nr:RpiB/LacA/LacB family sugar-phosphate isomerase [Prevotella sp.]